MEGLIRTLLLVSGTLCVVLGVLGAVMANNRLCGMVCDFAMVGKVNPAWYCSGRYYSSGKDKDIQTGDTEPPIAHGT
jgi:hypothetical protein